MKAMQIFPHIAAIILTVLSERGESMQGPLSTVARHAGWCVILLILVASTPAMAQKTYYIGLSSDYHGGTCRPGESNVANDTGEFDKALRSAGWKGKYVWNESNLPSAFVEVCLDGGGEDGLKADSATLAVYSGHGHIGRLAFSDPHNGICDVKLGWAREPWEGEARLGSMTGAMTGYAIWSASCTMNLANNNLGENVNWQWTQQQLGFHNSPSTGKYSLSGWWSDLSSRNNAAAWLNKLKYSPVFGNLTNTPIAVSYGPTEHWCWAVHNNANLKNGTYTYPRGGGPLCGATEQPEFWWCATWTNRLDCECDEC
jgi:hypothetical protein